MKKIIERDLIKLGFDKILITPEESGQKNYYYYYTYEIDKLCLISCTDDETIDGYYYVEFFDYFDIGRYYYLKQIKMLIKVLTSGIHVENDKEKNTI